MSFQTVGAAGAADALGAALMAVAEESLGIADGIALAALLVSVGAGGDAGGDPPPHATLAITGAEQTRRKAVRKIVAEVFMESPATPSR
ncbi:MAG: hypothetical protein ABI183_21635 [Polyangiaceae bacterium]